MSVGRRLLRPAAANVGIDHAEGDWIGFLDDDDFFEPTHVARLLARAAEPDQPRLVHAQLWGLDRYHRVAIQRDTRVNPLIMYYNCQIAAMSCIVHRSLVDAGIRLDETLETNEDWDLWLRLMAHTHFATVREPTHFYFAEAGTSGTGIGLNSHNRNEHCASRMWCAAATRSSATRRGRHISRGSKKASPCSARGGSRRRSRSTRK